MTTLTGKGFVETKKNWDEVVEIAIAKWEHDVSVDIHNMVINPKRAQKGIKILQDHLASQSKPNNEV